MHYHTIPYNTFALPTLTYIAQLERPPPATLAAEKQDLKKSSKDQVVGLSLRTCGGAKNISDSRFPANHSSTLQGLRNFGFASVTPAVTKHSTNAM